MRNSDVFECPDCGGPASSVVDSRPSLINGRPTIDRTRRCTACGSRSLRTVEIPTKVASDLYNCVSADDYNRLRIKYDGLLDVLRGEAMHR